MILNKVSKYLCNYQVKSYTESCYVVLTDAGYFRIFSITLSCGCSVTKSCLILRDPVDCSPPSFPVPHHLPEFAQVFPLSRWCHPTISSSVTRFSSCPQSFPASGSFPMSWLFTSGGQSIGASDSAVNIQGWFLLGFTGLISFQPKWPSKVFSSTIRQHQFFGAQPSLWSNS